MICFAGILVGAVLFPNARFCERFFTIVRAFVSTFSIPAEYVLDPLLSIFILFDGSSNRCRSPGEYNRYRVEVFPIGPIAENKILTL